MQGDDGAVGQAVRRLGMSRPSTLVGRAQERQQLWRIVDDGAAGTSAGAVLTGPAGIGKSALLAWLETTLRRDGHHRGYRLRPTAPHLEPPLGLWTRLASSAALQGVTVPTALHEGDPAGLTPAQRYGAGLALLEALTEGGQPTLLLLDDLHDADLSSLLLLFELLPSLVAAPITVIAAMRGPAAHPQEPARDVLTRLVRELELLAVAGLGPGEVGDLVRGELARGTQLTAADRDWAQQVALPLTTASDGNPLLIGALLTDLGIAEGRRPEPTTLDAVVVEGTAQQVAAKVVASLPARVLTVLAVLASAGEDADLALIEQVVGDPVAADIAAAVAAGVLEDIGGGVRFTHPSYREAVAEQGLEPRHHLALARAALARLRPGDRGLGLHHLLRAGSLVPPGEVFTTAGAAAEEAESVGDFAAAAQALQAAIDHHPAAAAPAAAPQDSPTVTAVRLRAAEAAHRAGLRAEAWAYASEVAAVAGQVTPEELARAGLLLAEGRGFVVDRREVVQVLELAEQRLGADHPLAGEVLAARAEMTYFRPEIREPGSRGITASEVTARDLAIARQLADRALASAGEDGDLRARSALAWRRCYPHPEFHARRRTVSAQAAAGATDPTLRGRALVEACIDALEGGEMEAAANHWREATSAAWSTGDLELRHRVAVVEAMMARAQGRLTHARTARAAAFTAGERTDEPGGWPADVAIGGLLDAELDLHGAALDTLIDYSGHVGSLALNAAAAYGLALRGQHAHASALLDDRLAGLLAVPEQEDKWTIAVAFTADAVAALGRADLAPAFIEVLQASRELIAVDVVDGFGCHGSLARPLGRLLALTGDLDAAEDAFATAQRVDGAAGLALYELHGRVDRLEAVVAAGRPVTAARRQAVADDARAMGANTLLRRVSAQELRRAPVHLTDRQRAVLERLATGATYGEIAADIGYSHSTVRKDVLAIYRLLQVHDRDGALAEARRRGLLL